MKARPSLASAPFNRWWAMRRTFSRRACFCSRLGKCMGMGRYGERETDIVLQSALRYPRLPAREDTMKMRLAVALALAIAAAAPAAAQELAGTLRKVRDSGSITIGHRESSIPFSFLDDRQQPVGYSMDICAA